MSGTYIKLLVSWFAVVAAFPLMHLTGWFGVMIPVGLVLGVLYWFDAARELRDSEHALARLAGLVMGVPQALLGLGVGGLGLAIIGWVIYNSFMERQESYTGGFMTFGLAPAMVVVGFGWMRAVLRRTTRSRDEAGQWGEGDGHM